MQNFPVRLRKLIFEKILGRLFYLRQSDAVRMTGPMRFICGFNQALNEKGIAPPWIYTRKECLEFWSSINNTSASDGNHPEKYALKDRGIVDVLHAFWSPQVQLTHSILELGCNAGGNLHWLNELGFHSLRGVEINMNAVRQLRESFPELSRKLQLEEDDIESALGKMRDNSVDVIFTMGVAMHIHPKDNRIFSEIFRVAAKYICTVEPETANSNYVFARNYRRVYERLGAAQLKSCLITRHAFPEIPNPGLTLRLFSAGTPAKR